MPTICKECKNLRMYAKNPFKDIWYNMFCLASELEAGFDPVTGESGFKMVNDFGGAYITDCPFGYCRDKNTDGNCEDFIPK